MPTSLLLHQQRQYRKITRNILLLACLLVALALLTVPSILHALQRHEPSARIFRALLEINLIVLGMASSLYVWTRTIGMKYIQQLLFLPSSNNDKMAFDANSGLLMNPFYSNIQNQDDINDDDSLRNDDDSDLVASFVDENTLEDLPRNPQQKQPDDVLYSENDDDNEDASIVATLSQVPTAADVVHVFLDNLLLILIVLFLFAWSSSGYTSLSEWTQWLAWIAAPTFPLLLFLYGVFLLLLHRKHRPLWKVLACTIGAPLFPVTFRDGFVGDIITSSVRPMQDITFTLVYLCYGLHGWWSQNYAVVGEQQAHDSVEYPSSSSSSSSLQETLDPSILLPALEKSWFLHTILLPSCVIGPLWWRFLQTLRQTLDEKKRWPYLGNAFKYFFAAQVAVTGVYYPNWHGSTVWLTAFVIATLYQIYWDIFLDWGLLERSSEGLWRLRSERLYSSRALYWSIASINVILRFCWTLTFIPPQYLNPAGILIQQNKLLFLSPILASAEIVRRTLWGWLRFEYEVLKVQNEDGSRIVEGGDTVLAHDNGLELAPMKKMETVESTHSPLGMTLNSRVKSWNDMSSLNDTQILVELCLYAVTFVTLWLVAVAHRSTQ